MGKSVDYNIEVLKSKLNKAIEDGNIDEADLLANQISELMQIEINTEMPDGFKEQIKKRLRKERSNKFKHIVKVAGIILIAAIGLTATANAATGGKLFGGVKVTKGDQYYGQDSWIRINGKEVDPKDYRRADGSMCITNTGGAVEVGMGPQPVTLSPGINSIMDISSVPLQNRKCFPRVEIDESGHVYLYDINESRRDITSKIKKKGYYVYKYTHYGVSYEYKVSGAVDNIHTSKRELY